MPFRAGLGEYLQQAEAFLDACRSGDPEALRWIADHPGVVRSSLEEIQAGRFELSEAKQAVADWYGFDNWRQLETFVDAVLSGSSAAAQFEAAVEAVLSGNLEQLQLLLRQNPELIRMRSMRRHESTLLLYAGANGVEGYRQRTPKNAVGVVKILLDAGADVNAIGKMYGGASVLGLVATSVHPLKAGVQEPLLQLLLENGATLEDAVAPDDTRGSIVNACLANGRPEAAGFLASKGARLDLAGAAGTGQIDLVKKIFNGAGGLYPEVTDAQLETALMWACEYGHNDIVAFLLEKGADLNALGQTGLTGLHWAVAGAHPDTIRLLLGYGASLEIKNVYGGTALGQALWCLVNNDRGTDYIPIIELLLEAGAQIEPGTIEWVERQEFLSLTTRVRVAEILRKGGAES